MRVADGVYSGGVPQGELGFDTLEALGVRTVISVDAARPDVERASARGMRYAHVPVGYAGLGSGERLNLARALRDLPRPMYIHCHHGQHRGPTAVAVGLRTIGEISGERAIAVLETAGTSPRYRGLWADARNTVPAPADELDAWTPELPEVARVEGFGRAMAEMDRAFERLALVRGAGWAAPADHPDLVPTALAGRVVDLLRVSGDDPVETADPGAFVAALRDAAGHASALERALDAGDRASAERSWAALAASCKECHIKTRDRAWGG